jgi:uncharacterized protein YlxW (UPF0749 family)
MTTLSNSTSLVSFKQSSVKGVFLKTAKYLAFVIFSASLGINIAMYAVLNDVTNQLSVAEITIIEQSFKITELQTANKQLIEKNKVLQQKIDSAILIESTWGEVGENRIIAPTKAIAEVAVNKASTVMASAKSWIYEVFQ